jgi:hypothetical protein
MKKFSIVTIAIFMSVLLMSMTCSTRPGKPINDVRSPTGADFQVQLLFEYKGVQLYRFYDSGKYRYFTIGNGSFQPQTQTTTYTTSAGKGTTTYTESWVDGASSR